MNKLLAGVSATVLALTASGANATVSESDLARAFEEAISVGSVEALSTFALDHAGTPEAEAARGAIARMRDERIEAASLGLGANAEGRSTATYEANDIYV